jgi:hypothetical protein
VAGPLDLHIPLLIADPYSEIRSEWTSMFVVLTTAIQGLDISGDIEVRPGMLNRRPDQWVEFCL